MRHGGDGREIYGAGIWGPGRLPSPAKGSAPGRPPSLGLSLHLQRPLQNFPDQFTSAAQLLLCRSSLIETQSAFTFVKSPSILPTSDEHLTDDLNEMGTRTARNQRRGGARGEDDGGTRRVTKATKPTRVSVRVSAQVAAAASSFLARFRQSMDEINKVFENYATVRAKLELKHKASGLPPPTSRR